MIFLKYRAGCVPFAGFVFEEKKCQKTYHIGYEHYFKIVIGMLRSTSYILTCFAVIHYAIEIGY